MRVNSLVCLVVGLCGLTPAAGGSDLFASGPSGAAPIVWRFVGAFFPYLFTAARCCEDTDRALWQPVRDVWPDLVAPGGWPDQYLVGDDLLVVTPLPRPNPLSGAADLRLWIPPGRWIDWNTGLALDGPAEALLPLAAGELAVFTRAGAIIATPAPTPRSVEGLAPTALHCFRGDRGVARIYRGAGRSADHAGAPCEWTHVAQYAGDGLRRIVIGPTTGRGEALPPQRVWEIRLPDEWPALEVLVNGVTLAPAAAPGRTGWWYDAATFTTVVRVAQQDIREEIAVDVFAADEAMPDAGLTQGLRGFYRTLERAQSELGGRTPPGVEALLRLRDLLATDPNIAISFDRALPQYWYNALIELGQSEMPAAERTRWTLRLLGASIAPGARPGRKPGIYDIAIRIALAAPFGDISELTGRLSCIAVPPPAATPTDAVEFGGLAAGSPVLLSLERATRPGEPAPRFRADVEFTLREFSISVPVEFGL